MAQDSIFTKIIKGEIPCHKIYEDDKTIAFLDIHPIQPGHVLVVSKTQAPTFIDLNDADAAALWSTVRKVADHMRGIFSEKKRIVMSIEGFDVDHAHAHLIPVNTHEEFIRPQDMGSEPDHAALVAMAKKLSI